MSDQWHERNKPARLERRYVFKSYSLLRDFLERAAGLSEKEDLYPDMGFSKEVVNITIYADDDSDKLGDVQRRFAQELDGLFGEFQH